MGQGADSKQQNISVRLSIGTKLLLCIIFLLVTVIGFVDYSTILLLEKDRRAFTYQSQATEALLMSREFNDLVKPALNTLRLSLASNAAALQSVVNNQSELAAVSIRFVNLSSMAFQPAVQAVRTEVLSKSALRTADLEVPEGRLKQVIPDLGKSGVSFVNLSALGRPPILGVFLADLQFGQDPRGVPVAMGILPLGGLGKDVRTSRATIVGRDGSVLFDTEASELFVNQKLSADPLFSAAIASRLSTGAMEFDAGDGHYLGGYYRPGLDLVVLTRSDWQTIMRPAYVLREKFVLVGCMAVGLAIIIASIFANTITSPLLRLFEATRKVAAGDFTVGLKARSRDEVGVLTDSFVTMSQKILGLIEESAEKGRLEQELALASAVQQSLIPPSDYQSEVIRIVSHYQSATQCGGDWWGFFESHGRICMMVGDATGHGAASALLTAAAQSCFTVIRQLADEDPDFTFSPAAMLGVVNRVVHESAGGQIMMTFFVGVLNTESKTLTYANAAHNAPWLFKQEESGFSRKSLMPLDTRLGETANLVFQEQELEMGPGDILFLYTDGLTEGLNPEGQQYGKKRVLKTIEANLAKGTDVVVKTLIDDFQVHSAGKALNDDITLVMARMKTETNSGTGT